MVDMVLLGGCFQIHLEVLMTLWTLDIPQVFLTVQMAKSISTPALNKHKTHLYRTKSVGRVTLQSLVVRVRGLFKHSDAYFSKH